MIQYHDIEPITGQRTAPLTETRGTPSSLSFGLLADPPREPLRGPLDHSAQCDTHGSDRSLTSLLLCSCPRRISIQRFTRKSSQASSIRPSLLLNEFPVVDVSSGFQMAVTSSISLLPALFSSFFFSSLSSTRRGFLKFWSIDQRRT